MVGQRSHEIYICGGESKISKAVKARSVAAPKIEQFLPRRRHLILWHCGMVWAEIAILDE